MRNRPTSCSFLLVLALAAASLPAEEWSSWRGPYQNGYSPQTALIDTWSPEGENLIWRQNFVARSTPVVMGGRVFVNGRAGSGIHEQAVVAAFDAGTGEPIWERRYNLYLTTVALNRVGWASLTGDPETGYVYAQLVSGLFLCHDSDGNLVWSRSLKEEHGRFEGYGGRTASPVIDEDLIIVNMNNGSWGAQGPPRHRYYSIRQADRRGAVDVDAGRRRLRPETRNRVPDRGPWINGQRLLIAGNADGRIYALQARTGKKVWEFNLSKRGINSSPVVDDQGRVFISHSEENIDEGTLGRVIAIDGTGSGDLTKTGELWRWNRNKAGFPSPALHDGRLYVVNNSGNLAAVDTDTGEVYGELSIGTVGKASPVWADGKIYAGETNGHFAIIRPGDTSAEILARHQLKVPDGRYAELYGSAAIAYGRIYFTTEEGVYCLGDKDAPFEVAGLPTSEPRRRGRARRTAGDTARGARRDQGQSRRKSRLRGLRLRRSRPAARRGGSRLVAPGARGGGCGRALRFADDSGFQAGALVATSGDLTAEARIRVFPPLPWTEDFSAGKRGYWIGGGRYDIAEEGGESTWSSRSRSVACCARRFFSAHPRSATTRSRPTCATRRRAAASPTQA